jgi:hypothetical protein
MEVNLNGGGGDVETIDVQDNTPSIMNKRTSSPFYRKYSIVSYFVVLHVKHLAVGGLWLSVCRSRSTGNVGIVSQWTFVKGMRKTEIIFLLRLPPPSLPGRNTASPRPLSSLWMSPCIQSRWRHGKPDHVTVSDNELQCRLLPTCNPLKSTFLAILL